MTMRLLGYIICTNLFVTLGVRDLQNVYVIIDICIES